jgi:hypothetical protein
MATSTSSSTNWPRVTKPSVWPRQVSKIDD